MIKAELIELDRHSGRRRARTRVVVQFNPETLKLTHASSDLDASMASIGPGSTRLVMRLWFDLSAELAAGVRSVADVRELTQRVAYFITPQSSPDDPSKHVPPLVRFEWGSFRFDGVLELIEETLELFSADGRALRASLDLALRSDRVQFQLARRKHARGDPHGRGKLPTNAR